MELDDRPFRLVRGPLIALGVALLLCAQQSNAGWQQFTSPGDGLADNEIHALFQAHNGELWISTQQGANAFDGAHWRTFRDSLPSRQINAIVRDTSGRVWFGTVSGLARFDGRSWWRPDPSDPGQPGTRQVGSLLEDRAHDLWVGTTNGLFRYTPTTDHWQRVPDGFLAHANASQLYEDSHQRLWVGSPEGAAYASPSRDVWKPVVRVLSAPDSVFAVGEDSTGIWFGTHLGAWRLDSTRLEGSAPRWTHLGRADGLPSDTVFALTHDHAGLMWFGTALGVARYDGRSFRPETEFAPGSPMGAARALLADASGNVWVGTDRKGLLRFDGATVRNHYSSRQTAECPSQPSKNFPTDLPLASNCSGPMLQDYQGAMWFASHDSVGTSRLASDGVTWSIWRTTPNVPVANRVTALLEDRGHHLWFGSRFEGIAVSTDSARATWATHTTNEGLPSNAVRSLFLDAGGRVWAGTANGAAQWTGTTWSAVLDQGLAGDSVSVLGFAEDSQHTLWMRTSAGLWSLDAARLQLAAHGSLDGLPDDLVSALAVSPSGELWAGSAHGVSRWTGAVWESHGVAELGDSQVRSLYFDREGRLWVTLNIGMARREIGGAWTPIPGSALPMTAIDQVLEDRSGQFWFASPSALGNWNGEQFRVLLRSNGLATDRIQRLMEDSQGRIWASADGGLTRWEPDHTAPKAVILTDQPRVTAIRNAALTYGAGYSETGDLEFQSWWDADLPGAWTTTTTSTRTGLEDGVHTFHVLARDVWHNTSVIADTLSFVVDATPPPAVLSSPLFGRPVRDRVAIVGSTVDDRYVRHRVEVRALGAATWTTLDTSSVSVRQDTLAVWDTRGLADGPYEVRLSVDDDLGLVGTALVGVVVDNVAPFFDVTSPALIHAAQGGDVFTTGSEVHAYFPPLGFDRDATVSIDADTSGAAPPTLPDGATLRGPAWRIDWGKARLSHDGVLDLTVPAGVTQPLAVYYSAGGTWTRRGGAGTSAGAPITVPLSTAGRFALYAGGTPLGIITDVPISVIPRAFSPRGSFGSREVAISFTLRLSGSVSVKVYNRAGRLVRVVADGLGMPAGQGVVRWDGRDRDGRIADEGIYLVMVEVPGGHFTKTLAVLK